MFKREREEIKMRSLLAQVDFFESLQNRHQLWANDVDNPETAELHREIINLVARLIDQYSKLLNLYRKQTE